VADERATQARAAGVHALDAIHGAAAALAHMKRRSVEHIINVVSFTIPAGQAGRQVRTYAAKDETI
jgi:2-methylcitrate dehydratase PrpD